MSLWRFYMGHLGNCVYRHLLIIWQCFDTVHIDRKCLVASQDLMERLHQLLLLRSHIGFLFIEK